VFVRDRVARTTERVSVSTTGIEANRHSDLDAISPDGRFVVFSSLASNLVPADTNRQEDVFVRDRLTGTTERVSVGNGGEQARGRSDWGSISADGRFVAFHSSASNLVAGDTNKRWDVFVRDRLTGTTERVSVNGGGKQGNRSSRAPKVSGDGRFVAFNSTASNLVAHDTNKTSDVFVRDRLNGTTERVSVNSAAKQAKGKSFGRSTTPDMRFVAFDSLASNLVPRDKNKTWDVFLRDRLTGTTELVSAARTKR
jgi:Tol biopolymer transport system component